MPLILRAVFRVTKPKARLLRARSVRRLAADGYKVAILSSSGKGEALAVELGGLGVTGSNRSVADIQNLVDRAMERWG